MAESGKAKMYARKLHIYWNRYEKLFYFLTRHPWLVEVIMTIEKLNTLLDEVDAELKDSDVPINSRSLNATRLIAKRLDIDIPIFPSSCEYNGIINSINISHFIEKYFENKYGDLTKVDFSPGSYILQIQGDPFVVKIPGILGQINITIDKDLSRKYPRTTLNVLNFVTNLTQPLSDTLNHDDLKEIHNNFIINLNSFMTFSNILKEYKYFFEAYQDLKESVQQIVMQRTNFGKSKWASLQFIEKLLKGVIFSKIGTNQKTHDLLKLNSKLKEVTSLNLNEDLLKSIDCLASVRYDSGEVSLKEAITSHKAAMLIFSDVMSYLR